ncbi:MAG TPA: hypothetical protein VGF82_06385 [Terracidiphilus sp.]
MSHYRSSSTRMHSGLQASWLIIGVIGSLYVSYPLAYSQSQNSDDLGAKVQQLTDAMSATQRELEKSQRELEQLRSQLTSLRQQIADFHAVESTPSSAAELSAAVEQIREQQSVEEAQIATHEQAKVETESKYPLKLSGLVLLNGFVNTSLVDDPVAPTLVIAGAGSSGASMRQTVLGFEARGPRVFNAQSHADLHTDFYGAGSSTGGANTYADGLLRLRTAHASLDWEHTQAFFSLDHTILAPNTPTSLNSVAVPALGWSGNLWTWNPQFGVTQDVPLSGSARFRMQGAAIDVGNPPQIYTAASAMGVTGPNTNENSRWPGTEGRIAILEGKSGSGLELGAGGLFVPHRALGGTRFNSWAGTIDYRIPLPGRAEFSGSAYWGQALGGLGGGAYKDYVFSYDPLTGYAFRTLDNAGGWAQFKERASERLEFNAAFGTDQVPASQLRPFAGDPAEYYLNQARNRTFTANVIYRPSAYFLLSMEYRHIQSSPVIEYTATGDVIGIATGYRF